MARPDTASTAAETVLKGDPRNIEALEIKARASRDVGRHTDAEGTLRDMLILAPEHAWAFDTLVQMLIEAGREDEAETVAREIVALAPSSDDAHVKLGVFLSKRNAVVEGEWHFQRAIALAGRKPHLLLNLARNLKSQGRLDEAQSLCVEACQADPEALTPLMLLAETAEHAGQMDVAEAALERAEPIAHQHGLDLRLPRATLMGRGSRWRDGLEMLDTMPDLSGVVRLTRGRLREKAGRYGDAWQDFVDGKAAIAHEHGRYYDRREIERHFASIARAFSAPFWHDVPPPPLRRDVPQPIFVLGFPRSGTTMTEQVLSAHSQIRAGGELSFAIRLRDFAQQLLGQGSAFPTGMGRLAAADFHHIPALFRDHYLALAEAHGLTEPGARYFVDKMPLNEIYLPLIRLAFPNSPLIHIRRHPLDILSSVMAHDMTHGFFCGYRLADAAHQLAAAAQLMAYYRDTLLIPVHSLGYEQFVTDQVQETRRLMDHIGIAMEEAQLRFHENDRHAPTPSYAQVRQPIYRKSVGKWRRYAEQLTPILPLVQDAMADGGYAL